MKETPSAVMIHPRPARGQTLVLDRFVRLAQRLRSAVMTCSVVWIAPNERERWRELEKKFDIPAPHFANLTRAGLLGVRIGGGSSGHDSGNRASGIDIEFRE